MTSTTVEVPRDPAGHAWKPVVAEFQKPSRKKATWQIVNTLGGYAALWVLLCLSTTVSWWLTVPLAVLTGGMMIRVFIISHDCGHGSFLASRRANDFWGFVTGILSFTPYYHWRWEHAIHHGSAGNLDRRGVGDVWTMTVREYLDAPRWQRIAYRCLRHPFVLLVIGPLVLLLLKHRVPSSQANKRERRSVWWTNLALLGVAVGMSFIIGVVPYLIIQLTVLGVAGSIGIWLFFVQHQFEDAYWARDADWDFSAAALRGSTFLALPRVLQWFSGNIGFHHVHHLSARVPNYNLQACHESHEMFQTGTPMTIKRSVRAFGLVLWDEASKKLVRFRHVRRLRRREKLRARAAASHD